MYMYSHLMSADETLYYMHFKYYRSDYDCTSRCATIIRIFTESFESLASG